jgi:hypothetical protein
MGSHQREGGGDPISHPCNPQQLPVRSEPPKIQSYRTQKLENSITLPPDAGEVGEAEASGRGGAGESGFAKARDSSPRGGGQREAGV